MAESRRNLYKPTVIEDITFTAGENKILWRIQVLKTPRNDIIVKMSRIGRRVINITFRWDEIPDLIEHVNKRKNINLKR